MAQLWLLRHGEAVPHRSEPDAQRELTARGERQAEAASAALADGFDADDARELLLAHDDDARVLAVGHDPSFTQVVHDLTGARVDFKKGGIAAIELSGKRGELIVLLRPR